MKSLTCTYCGYNYKKFISLPSLILVFSLDNIMIVSISSRPEVLLIKVIQFFTKFTGKHLCCSFFFYKVAGLRQRFFPVNFAKSLGTTSFFEHLLWWLLLYIKIAIIYTSFYSYFFLFWNINLFYLVYIKMFLRFAN